MKDFRTTIEGVVLNYLSQNKSKCNEINVSVDSKASMQTVIHLGPNNTEHQGPCSSEKYDFYADKEEVLTIIENICSNFKNLKLV